MGEIQERSCSFTNLCLACGRSLKGRGTKRWVPVGYPFGSYVCYGKNKCEAPEKRYELLTNKNGSKEE